MIMQVKDIPFPENPLQFHPSLKTCKNECELVPNKYCFFEQMRTEIQRSQRSKTPLSIILLTLPGAKIEGMERQQKYLEKLRSLLRETDIAGYVSPKTIGILLPYTERAGITKISEKITIALSDLVFSIQSGTYPNQIFDSLEKNGCVSTDVLELMFECDAKKSIFQLKIKRLIDILGSLFACILLSPIMLLTAILIKLDSAGPIIFKQQRLGYQGKPFTFYKFRSMRTGTSDQIHRDYIFKHIKGNLTDINEGSVKPEKPLYKIKSDPRVTPFGKFIRKTSIDELPQLYNVLKGDMSLVGPRPPLAYEVGEYQSWHLRRILEMKPGITGLWQVDGRSRTEFNDAVRLDVRYIQTWSLILDFKILVKTVSEVLRCRGAV